jgi:hypothetical protein
MLEIKYGSYLFYLIFSWFSLILLYI